MNKYIMILTCLIALTACNVSDHSDYIVIDGSSIMQLDYLRTSYYTPDTSGHSFRREFVLTAGNIQATFTCTEIEDLKSENIIYQSGQNTSVEILEQIASGEEVLFSKMDKVYKIDTSELIIRSVSDYKWLDFQHANDSVQTQILLRNYPYAYNTIQYIDCAKVLTIGQRSHYIPSIGYLKRGILEGFEYLISIDGIPVEKYLQELCKLLENENFKSFEYEDDVVF